MKTQELEFYIKAFLNKGDVDKKVFDEINNIQLILTAYSLGLRNEKFEPELLMKKFILEKDTEPQFHTLVGQMSIVKGEEKNNNYTNYLLNNVSKGLEQFKAYFTKR